ncbi:MAG: hypothetical protein ABSH35_00735 [Isosphaeraceae bacterium]|jgi:hypothetical protein
MRARYCRHCGDWVPHDAPSAICGRCACVPVAERGPHRTTPPATPPARVPETVALPSPASWIHADRTSDCRPLAADPDPLAGIRRHFLSRSFGPMAFTQARP